jgi:serine/threonine protein kinase
LSKYTYNKDKPAFSTSNYAFYHATIKESNTSVTLKTMKYPHVELGPYLLKLKEVKSENVVKVYDLLVEQQFLAIVTEPVLFGNFKKALEKCKYLDEPDAIFVAKQILNGHIDLMRADSNWFGTE